MPRYDPVLAICTWYVHPEIDCDLSIFGREYDTRHVIW